VKRLLGGTYAAFASREIAERVAGRVSGTIFPFAFDPELELVEPPALHPRADLVLDLPDEIATILTGSVALSDPK
jgi:Ala-tRNA(Pro) deacylase